MSQSNPILVLAERVQRDQLSHEQAHEAVLQLIDQGLFTHDLNDALTNLDRPNASPSEIALIGEIVIDVWWHTREAQRDERVVTKLANLWWHFPKTALTKLAQLETSPITNVRAIMHLCDRLLPHIEAGSQEYGRILLSMGQATAGLANLGINLATNYRQAIKLFEQVCELLAPSSPEYGRALIGIGQGLNSLVLFGIEVDDHMEKAAHLYERARSCFEPQSLDYRLALLGEGEVRYALAHSGIEPSIHVQRAAELFQLYHDVSSPDDAIAVAHAGLAYLSLGRRGIDTASNLQQALTLLDKSCRLMTTKDHDYGVVLLNIGYVHAAFVNAGIESEEQRELAIARIKDARQFVAAKSWEEGQALLNEGQMRGLRGVMKHDPNDVYSALDLHARVRLCVDPDSLFYGLALSGEAISCMALARLLNARNEHKQVWNDPLVYLKRASDLCDEALHLAEVAGGMQHRLALRNKGQVLTLMAQFGQDPEANGRQAQALLSQALRHLHPESKEYGQDLCYLANLLFQLSNADNDWEANANQAMDLFEQADGCLSPGTPDYDWLLVSAIAAMSGWIARGLKPETAVPRLMKWVEQARKYLIPGSMGYGMLLDTLATTGMALMWVGQYGIETKSNVDQAKTLLRLFLEHDICKPENGHSLLKHGEVRSALSKLGIEPVANTRQAIDLYQQARVDTLSERLDKWSQDYGDALSSEGQARMDLADLLGRESEQDLMDIIGLCEKAREHLHPRSQTFTQVLYCEAIARRRLAGLWIHPVENLGIARDLCKQVMQDSSHLTSSSREYVLAQTCLADTLIHLAMLDIDRESNTVEAKEHLNKFLKAPRGWNALFQAAQAYLALADLSGNSRSEIEKYLHDAIDLFDKAKESLTLRSWGYGQILLRKAFALQKWPAADKDTNPGMREAIEVVERKRLEEAVETFREARKCFAIQSGQYLLTLLGEANVLWDLALYGASREILTRKHAMSAENEKQVRDAVNLMSQIIEQFDTTEFDTIHPRLTRAHGLWLLHESELAYRCMKEGLEAAEKIRGRMASRYERIRFLEINSIIMSYLTMVRICLGLADQASTEPDRQSWRLEAWHWVHRSKSRDLREQLAGKADDGAFLDTLLNSESWIDLSQDLDRLDDKIRALAEKKDGKGHRGSILAKFRRVTRHKNPEAEIKRLEEDRARLLQHWKDACKPIIQRTLDKEWGVENIVPSPHQVIHDLREMANIDSRPDEKPLLVEFCILGDYEWVVFLVPLWKSEPHDPLIIVYPHQADAASTTEMAMMLHKATLGLRPDWYWDEKDLGPKEQAETPQKLMEQLIAEMGAKFIGPWGHHLRDWKPTELILAPHWLLNVLPLHIALWKNDAGKDEPLISSYPITYLPSAALAGEVEKRRKPLKPGSALIIGDATKDLKSAQDEIKWIKDYLTRSKFTPEPLIGPKATTNIVFEGAVKAAILHIATHSVYKADFLRSGFALADRRMTIVDMLINLKLPNAVLAYLGSCDSGYQGMDAWNELMALVRVFLQAGSPTVVASLWPVDDPVAAEFAAHFYKGWLVQGLSLSRALQRATLATRKAHKEDVLHWAPFTLMGAWNTRIEKTNQHQF